MAQELMKVIPEAVEQDANGYYTVNTDPIFWSMVNAVQDLGNKREMNSADQEKIHSMVEQNKRDIASLKKAQSQNGDEIKNLKTQLQQKDQQIEDLKSRLERLEKMILKSSQ